MVSEVELVGPGMRVKNTALYLDATKRTDLSFVSHAHGDHIARHAQVIATLPTLNILEHRVGSIRTPMTVPFGQRFNLGQLELELIPAGHVLGSAQLRFTRNGRRTVYTGDLNTVATLTTEPTEVAHCDVLVMESTFGHPRYKFPPREETFARMREFVKKAHADGALPVFLAYALGKSQEAMKALADLGPTLVAHESISKVCDIYAKHGIAIPHRRFEYTASREEILFFPPNLSRSDTLKRLAPVRKAVLTGWAIDVEETKRRYGCDEAFPLSDHADFDGLVNYALSTGAKRIYTTHGGYAKELAQTLRDMGKDATPLEEPKQMQLF